MIMSDCFNCLPVASLVEEKIPCVHSGLSHDLKHLDQIRSINHYCKSKEFIIFSTIEFICFLCKEFIMLFGTLYISIIGCTEDNKSTDIHSKF